MKKTYLVLRPDGEGNKRLDIATEEEWKEIISENKVLPADRRRYFINDTITEGTDIDMMVIEVSKAEHAKWNKEHMEKMRNLKAKEQFSFFSLDAPSVESAELLFCDAVPASNDMIDRLLCDMAAADIRKRLQAWKPWAADFFDLFYEGKEIQSAAIVAEKYHISKRQARRYKSEVLAFIKKLAD